MIESIVCQILSLINPILDLFVDGISAVSMDMDGLEVFLQSILECINSARSNDFSTKHHDYIYNKISEAHKSVKQYNTIKDQIDNGQEVSCIKQFTAKIGILRNSQSIAQFVNLDSFNEIVSAYNEAREISVTDPGGNEFRSGSYMPAIELADFDPYFLTFIDPLTGMFYTPGNQIDIAEEFCRTFASTTLVNNSSQNIGMLLNQMEPMRVIILLWALGETNIARDSEFKCRQHNLFTSDYKSFISKMARNTRGYTIYRDFDNNLPDVNKFKNLMEAYRNGNLSNYLDRITPKIKSVSRTVSINENGEVVVTPSTKKYTNLEQLYATVGAIIGKVSLDANNIENSIKVGRKAIFWAFATLLVGIGIVVISRD